MIGEKRNTESGLVYLENIELLEYLEHIDNLENPEKN